jgi:hypothetical protein
MNNRPMAYGDEIFHHGRQTRIGVKNRPVLDIRTPADHNLFRVAPNDGAVPDAGAVRHLDAANYSGVWGNKCRLRKIGGTLERSRRKR